MIGRSRATATQSAAVSGSIDNARRNILPAATRPLPPPDFPGFRKLGQNLCPIDNAHRGPLPDRVDDDRSAILRMQDRHQRRGVSTDAGPLSAIAAPAGRRFAAFGRCFSPAISDQLVNQASIGCDVREETPHPLRCGTPTLNHRRCKQLELPVA